MVRCRAPHAARRRRLDAPRARASRSTHAHLYIPCPAALPLKLIGEGAPLSPSSPLKLIGEGAPLSPSSLRARTVRHDGTAGNLPCQPRPCSYGSQSPWVALAVRWLSHQQGVLVALGNVILRGPVACRPESRRRCSGLHVPRLHRPVHHGSASCVQW